MKAFNASVVGSSVSLCGCIKLPPQKTGQRSRDATLLINKGEMSGKVSDSKERIQDLLRLDDITIEPVAQKKGLIVRHVEYSVKSEKFRSEVVRRYSDFQTLQDLLLARFPYRLVPRLPPAKLMANVVAVSSDFIGDRKNALVRWLTIVASHPVVGDDQMVKFFMTDMMNDHGNSLREQFRFFPDEFVMNEMGAQV